MNKLSSDTFRDPHPLECHVLLKRPFTECSFELTPLITDPWLLPTRLLIKHNTLR